MKETRISVKMRAAVGSFAIISEAFRRMAASTTIAHCRLVRQPFIVATDDRGVTRVHRVGKPERSEIDVILGGSK